jgi:hypothetical protein
MTAEALGVLASSAGVAAEGLELSPQPMSEAAQMHVGISKEYFISDLSFARGGQFIHRAPGTL